MEQTRYPTIIAIDLVLVFARLPFQDIKRAGEHGSGIDTIVLLEERMDLRIQVEATISDLFNRRISLQWNSGMLIPLTKIEGELQDYRLDRDECHGIKELVVLLTHLYNDQYSILL